MCIVHLIVLCREIYYYYYFILLTKTPRLVESIKALVLLYDYLCRIESIRRKLVANASNKQLFEPREWGLRVVLFCHNFTYNMNREYA